jgi:uncharacterized membrane protein
MKNSSLSKISLWIMVVLSWVITLVSYKFVPDKIPLHWNVYGQIDNWGNKFPGIFIFPGIILFVVILMKVVPAIDPRKANYERFIGAYQGFQVGVVAVLLSLNLIVLYASAINTQIEVDFIVKLLVGILFVILGNLMPKIKNNYFVGIRTPWTIASEDVWFKTHRLAGFIWFAGGILMTMLAFIKGVVSAGAYFSVIAVVALVPVIYSYIYYKKNLKS